MPHTPCLYCTKIGANTIANNVPKFADDAHIAKTLRRITRWLGPPPASKLLPFHLYRFRRNAAALQLLCPPNHVKAALGSLSARPTNNIVNTNPFYDVSDSFFRYNKKDRSNIPSWYRNTKRCFLQ